MEKANLFNVSTAVLCEAAFAMKRKGLHSAEIARELCLTGAAVSQYLNHKRGGSWKLRKEAKDHLRAVVAEHYRAYPMVAVDRSLSTKLCAVIAEEVG